MAGLYETDVQHWAAHFFHDHFLHRIFLPQKKLISDMFRTGFDVWIVSASCSWIIQACAVHFQINPSKVLAVTAEVENGIITDRIIRPVPYREGKVAAIKYYIKRQPDYVAGDSLGDREMLNYAKTLRMFIKKEEDQKEVELSEDIHPNQYLKQFFPPISHL